MTSATSYKQMTDIFVCGLGAVTPVGLTAPASAAAVRAGISGFAEHPFMVDSVGEPMFVAQCPLVESHKKLERRIFDCLIAAIREALGPLYDGASVGQRAAVNLFVNLPAMRPGLPADLSTRLKDSLEQNFTGVFTHIEIVQLGNAGSLLSLQSALRLLFSNPLETCIVAGSDSYLDPDTLEWLEDTDQFHCAGPRNNAWGFIPGEGAGAVLLATGTSLKRNGLRAFSRLVKVGVGHEVNKIRTDTVCIGDGLTAAFRAALTELPEDVVITDVYCDMNGEPYRGDEYGFTIARTRERFLAATDFVAPADCWGDVGAASATLLIVLICVAFTKGYASGKTGLVWASSNSGERGAAILEAIGGR